MTVFFRKSILLSLIFLLLPLVNATKPSEDFHRSFLQPYYHGQQLNYCTLDGKCGLSVANRYCRIMGYKRADQHIIANNVGLSNYLDAHARCVGWKCNGFKLIRCVNLIKHKPPSIYYYRLKHFAYPRFNHYRVDWCYDGAHHCGKRAAHSFCRRLGYSTAKKFTIEKHVPATQAIGNQKLCFGPQCNAFSKIDCYR